MHPQAPPIAAFTPSSPPPAAACMAAAPAPRAAYLVAKSSRFSHSAGSALVSAAAPTCEPAGHWMVLDSDASATRLSAALWAVAAS